MTAIFFLLAFLAQNVTLRGIVTDETGGIVPGATVLLRGAGAAASQTTSGNDGAYSFSVPPGNYTVEAIAPDLKAGPTNVAVGAGGQVLDLQLKIALATQQVTVEERAATVTPEPANNASATVLAGNDLESLSDNPDDLIADLIAIAGP